MMHCDCFLDNCLLDKADGRLTGILRQCQKLSFRCIPLPM